MSLIAAKYAEAAFKAAQKSGTTEQFLADLQLFTNNFSEEMAIRLANPSIHKKILVEIINSLAGKLELSKQANSFLRLVASARRLKLIRSICLEFLKLVKSHQKILEVELLVVERLNELKLADIKNLLHKKYPDYTLEITQTIKKEILGGLIIRINSLTIDASLKNQLLNLESACQATID